MHQFLLLFVGFILLTQPASAQKILIHMDLNQQDHLQSHVK